MPATALVASSCVVRTAVAKSRVKVANCETTSSSIYGHGTPRTLRKFTTGSGRSSIATDPLYYRRSMPRITDDPSHAESARALSGPDDRVGSLSRNALSWVGQGLSEE